MEAFGESIGVFLNYLVAYTVPLFVEKATHNAGLKANTDHGLRQFARRLFVHVAYDRVPIPAKPLV